MNNNINKPLKITGYTSKIFDSLRIFAALTVLVYHTFLYWSFPSAILFKLGDLAHTSVIIFFVLSGYLISYTTSISDRGGIKYMEARFSRLYSVVIPCLVITAICECIIWYCSPSLHSDFTRATTWPRYLLTGLFVNETWFISAAPPLNSPLWSLSYEFWYYMIFGFWYYKKSGTRSYILPLIVCLIAGPKILLMMPIWIIGYFAYTISPPAINKKISWFIFVIFLVLALLLPSVISPLPYKLGTHPWFFSSQFLTDWLAGLFVGFALWIMPKDSQVKSTTAWTKVLRIAGDVTFPIYVLHYPLIVLWDAIFPHRVHNVSQLWQPFLSVLIVSVIIGIILEKQRYLWRRIFEQLFSYGKKIIDKFNRMPDRDFSLFASRRE